MAKKKKFILHFYRSNPQLASGGYDTTHEYEGTLAGAKKYAAEISAHTVYGGMILTEIEEINQ